MSVRSLEDYTKHKMHKISSRIFPMLEHVSSTIAAFTEFLLQNFTKWKLAFPLFRGFTDGFIIFRSFICSVRTNSWPKNEIFQEELRTNLPSFAFWSLAALLRKTSKLENDWFSYKYSYPQNKVKEYSKRNFASYLVDPASIKNQAMPFQG